jgi:PKD repeat protein
MKKFLVTVFCFILLSVKNIFATIYVNEPVTLKGISEPGVSYKWLIEGKVYDGAFVQYTFTEAGTYEIKLQGKKGNRISSEKKMSVTVVNRDSPTATPVVMVDGVVKTGNSVDIIIGESVDFSSNSKDADGGRNIIEKWYLDGRKIERVRLKQLLNKIGTYAVKLEVFDGRDYSKKDSKTLNINIKAPQLDISSVEGVVSESLGTKNVKVHAVITGDKKYIKRFKFDLLENEKVIDSRVTSNEEVHFNLSNKKGTHKYLFRVKAYTTFNTLIEKVSSGDIEVENDGSNNRPTILINANPGNTGTTETVFKFFVQGSDADGDVLSYKWIFPGGKTINNKQNVEYTFEKAGEYEVQVEANDGLDTVIKKIKVRITDSYSRLVIDNKPPIVKIRRITPSKGNIKTLFKMYSDVQDPDGDYVKLKWDMGDGAIFDVKNVVYRYVKPGTYTVKLIGDDGSGKKIEDTKTITVSDILIVENKLPEVKITKVFPSLTGTVKTFFKFNSRVFDADGDYVELEWDMGDGTKLKTKNPGYRYTKPGTYIVKLRGEDGRGGMKEDVVKVVVKGINKNKNKAPKVKISKIKPGLKGDLKTLFQMNSKVFDADGDFVSVKWDMGDGTVLEGRNIQYRYDEVGSYNVKVIGSDGVETVENSVTVSVKAVDELVNNAPKVKIMNVNPAMEGDTHTFFIFSARVFDADGDYVSTEWDMGNSVILKGLNPGYRYSEAGTYTVKLKGSDGVAFAEDVITIKVKEPESNEILNNSEDLYRNHNKRVYKKENKERRKANEELKRRKANEELEERRKVNEELKKRRKAMISDFEILGVLPSTGGTVSTLFEFKSLLKYEDLDNISLVWDFGDGEKSLEKNPKHIFRRAGEYQVVLSGSNSKGELLTDSITIKVVNNGEQIPENNKRNRVDLLKKIKPKTDLSIKIASNLKRNQSKGSACVTRDQTINGKIFELKDQINNLKNNLRQEVHDSQKELIKKSLSDLQIELDFLKMFKQDLNSLSLNKCVKDLIREKGNLLQEIQKLNNPVLKLQRQKVLDGVILEYKNCKYS